MLKKLWSYQTTKHTLSNPTCQAIFSNFLLTPFCNLPFPCSHLVSFLFPFLLFHSSFLFPVCSPFKNISHLYLSWSWTHFILESLSPSINGWIKSILPPLTTVQLCFSLSGTHMFYLIDFIYTVDVSENAWYKQSGFSLLNHRIRL